MVKNQSCDVNKLTKLIQNYVPAATMESSIRCVAFFHGQYHTT